MLHRRSSVTGRGIHAAHFGIPGTWDPEPHAEGSQKSSSACSNGEDFGSPTPCPPPLGIRPRDEKEAKMFDIKRKTIEWGGKTLTLETGRMARQADGAVLATYGETMVLATAVFAKSAKPGQDFFPLTVNYQEKFYAAGKRS